MPVQTRPRQGVASRSGGVQHSGAQSSCLPNICAGSNSGSGADLETHSASNLDPNRSGREAQDSEVHLQKSNSDSDDEVIFVKERRVPQAAVADSNFIRRKPTESVLGVPIPNNYPVTYVPASAHAPQSLSSSSSKVPSLSRAEAEAVVSVLRNLKRLTQSSASRLLSTLEYPGPSRRTSGGDLFRNLPVEVCSKQAVPLY